MTETRWSPELETVRRNYHAAGIQPYLYTYWRGTSSDRLHDAAAEYLERSPAIRRDDPDLADELEKVAADIVTELDYRARPEHAGPYTDTEISALIGAATTAQPLEIDAHTGRIRSPWALDHLATIRQENHQ